MHSTTPSKMTGVSTASATLRAPPARRRALAVCVGAALLPACGGEGPSSDDVGDGPTPVPSAELTSVCSREGDTFHVGLERPGFSRRTQATIVEADPSPPGRGDNRWLLQIDAADSSGALEGADLFAQTWMPDFLLPGARVPSVTELGDGRYEVSPIHFVMPGLWEVRLFVTPNDGSGVPDQVRFSFCIP